MAKMYRSWVFLSVNIFEKLPFFRRKEKNLSPNEICLVTKSTTTTTTHNINDFFVFLPPSNSACYDIKKPSCAAAIKALD